MTNDENELSEYKLVQRLHDNGHTLAVITAVRAKYTKAYTSIPWYKFPFNTLDYWCKKEAKHQEKAALEGGGTENGQIKAASREQCMVARLVRDGCARANIDATVVAYNECGVLPVWYELDYDILYRWCSNEDRLRAAMAGNAAGKALPTEKYSVQCDNGNAAMYKADDAGLRALIKTPAHQAAKAAAEARNTAALAAENERGSAMMAALNATWAPREAEYIQTAKGGFKGGW